MNTNTANIKVENSYANIIHLALPISVAILIPQLSMIINTYFLGTYNGVHYSSQEMLSIMAVAGIYFLTLAMIGYGLSNGLLMLMSRRAGNEDAKGLGFVFANGVWLGLILSIVLIVLSKVVAPYLFDSFIHEPKIKWYAKSFIQIRLWGLPFIILAQLGNQLFLATNKSSKIIIGTITQTILNIFFDYCFIFGHFGFAEQGILGAAYASIIAEAGYFFIVFIQIQSHAYFKPFSISYIQSFNFKAIGDTFITSSPLMLQNFLSIASWEVFIIFVEHTGKLNAAISQLLRSVFGVVGIATWALSGTCNSMVSNLIGQKKYDDVFPLLRKIILVSFSCAFVFGCIMLVFPSQFLGLLTSDTEIIQQGVAPLRVVVFAIWLLSISLVLFNAVLGTGNTRANLLFEIVAIVVYLCYIYFVIERARMSISFAWGSEFVYWTCLLTMSLIYLKSNKWRNNKINEI